jgi:hypothetical protein
MDKTAHHNGSLLLADWIYSRLEHARRGWLFLKIRRPLRACVFSGLERPFVGKQDYFLCSSDILPEIC